MEPVEEPVLTVVKGAPTPEELAAVVAAVQAKLATARAAADTKTDSVGRKPATGWAAYWRNTRRPLQPGPGAWRRSALPH